MCLCVYANMYINMCLFKENKSLYITCKYIETDIYIYIYIEIDR